MRGLLTGLLLLIACPAAAIGTDPLEYTDLADDFLAFWDETEGLDPAERARAFDARIAPLSPAFYRRDDESEADRLARYARALEAFAPLRGEAGRQHANFETNLRDGAAALRQVFPDARLDTPVTLLFSLGAFNGRTQSLAGERVLLFGIDGLARYHEGQDTTALFVHELFHIHHRRSLPVCRRIWCILWREGLAVHVAAETRPGATPAELLLTMPDPDMVAKTDARLCDALTHLQSNLNSGDRQLRAALFSFREDETGLPARRGYLLGQRVAQKISETMTLQEMTGLSGRRARRAVSGGVEALITDAGC